MRCLVCMGNICSLISKDGCVATKDCPNKDFCSNIRHAPFLNGQITNYFQVKLHWKRKETETKLMICPLNFFGHDPNPCAYTAITVF